LPRRLSVKLALDFFDVTNASRTLLMDLRTLDWDAEILKLMGIPRQMLPRWCNTKWQRWNRNICGSCCSTVAIEFWK
jgi:glycerol kinase